MATNKTTNIIGWVLTGLVCFALIGSGCVKLFKPEMLAEPMKVLGLTPYMTMIGLIEIVAVVLYLIPKTNNIGFLLMTCYIAGIIVAEWVLGDPTLGIVLNVLLWVGMYLRKPYIFGLNN